ncbi:hypothetical protein MPSEU_000327700 [Mayamaea pseudoterrestris]|nr:hypothetical protein MPSEU_000327700 [Mayamaea pseudoterrestris]
MRSVHHLLPVWLCISIASIPLSAASSCPLPSDVRVLRNDLTMREVVNPSTNTITIQMNYQGETWLAFGVNPDGEMIGGDAIIGLPETGSVMQYDMRRESMRGVKEWTTQSLTNSSITQENGVTVLTFTMPLVNDNQHEILADGPNTFLYAYGYSNTLAVHKRAEHFRVRSALQSCVPATGLTTNYDGTTTDGTDAATSGFIDTSAPVATASPTSAATVKATGETSAPLSAAGPSASARDSYSAASSSSSSTSCALSSDAQTLMDGLTFKHVVNPDNAAITIELTYEGEAWLGFGVNPDGEMIGGDAVIGLPDTNSVMQYDMTGEGLDLVTPWSTQTLSETSIIQTDGVTILTYTMPLVNDNQNVIQASGPNTFIFAVGFDNTLNTHAIARSFTMEEALLTCDTASQSTPTTDNNSITGSSNGDNASTSAGSISDELARATRTKRLWMAHGLLLSVSWGILTPLAIGCSVLRRKQGGTWFVLHSSLNNLVFLTTTIGFAIAVYILGKEGDQHFSGERHNLLGLFVFLLLFVQVMSGWFRPKLPTHAAAARKTVVQPNEEEGEHVATDIVYANDQATAPKKSCLRLMFEMQHRILGLVLLILAWYQVHLGIELYEEEFTMNFNGKAIFFGVAFTITGLIILAKIALIVRNRRR